MFVSPVFRIFQIAHSHQTPQDKFGFCFVSGVPPSPEATEELSTRIGFIRTTHYGGFWDFTADLARGDTAYTNLALPAHTDNTYFTDPCGLQIFHLLHHDGKGGQTLLVDGFYVAGLLKELNPAAYEQLCTQEVSAHAAGEEDIMYRAKAPVLTRDARGELVRVRWNNDDRSVVRNVSGSDMLAWYDAMREWNKGLTSADAEYWVKLTPGTVVGALFIVAPASFVTTNVRAYSYRQSSCTSRPGSIRRNTAYVRRIYWRGRVPLQTGRSGREVRA